MRFRHTIFIYYFYWQIAVMKVDEKHRNSEMMALAKSYHFESVSQFMAIFETSGYEAFIQDGDICIKRGGQVQDRSEPTDGQAAV